ncbi:MAG: NAD(P)/FAD-dependent oxidoreductase, partial [Halobacteria archaeon]|nr:NAD(P)/FAD-dependent oxidoreductase [Halobacteria archaeon]
TMQTVADDRVFVAGDANGKEPILHVAKEQGYKAADNILASAGLSDGDVEPYEHITHRVVFSGLAVYPYARLGLTEDEAREQGIDYVTATRRAENDGVFKTKYVPHGLAKLIVDADDGTVLGYQGLHYHADVMAKTLQVVIENGMDVRDLPDRAYHPTTPEILDAVIGETSEKVGR